MMNKFALKILMLVLLLPAFAFPQEGRSVFQIIGSDISESVSDGLRVYTSPLHWKEKDGLTLGVLALTTAAAYLKDESIRANSFKQHSEINDKIMDAGKLYGNLVTPVVIGGGIYTAGLFAKNEDIRITGRMVFEAVLYSGIITTISKTVLGRARPNKDRGSNYFKPFTIDDGYVSMPSGHSTVAFALSSVLANRIHNLYASIGLYTFAGITAISRIYHDQHWASDVILGAACGYFIGDFISSGINTGGQGGKYKMKIYPGLGTLNFNLSL